MPHAKQPPQAGLNLVVRVLSAWGMDPEHIDGDGVLSYVVVSETVKSVAFHCSDIQRTAPSHALLEACCHRYADLTSNTPKSYADVLSQQHSSERHEPVLKGGNVSRQSILYLGTGRHSLGDSWETLANTSMLLHVFAVRQVEKPTGRKGEKKPPGGASLAGGGGISGINTLMLGAGGSVQGAEQVSLSLTLAGTGMVDLRSIIGTSDLSPCDLEVTVASLSNPLCQQGHGQKKEEAKGKRQAGEITTPLTQCPTMCKLRVRLEPSASTCFPPGIDVGVEGLFGFSLLGTRSHPGPLIPAYSNRYSIQLLGNRGDEAVSELSLTQNTSKEAPTHPTPQREQVRRISGGFHAVTQEPGASPTPLALPNFAGPCMSTANTRDTRQPDTKKADGKGHTLIEPTFGREKLAASIRDDRLNDESWQRATNRDEFCVAFPELTDCGSTKAERWQRILECIRDVVLSQFSSNSSETSLASQVALVGGAGGSTTATTANTTVTSTNVEQQKQPQQSSRSVSRSKHQAPTNSSKQSQQVSTKGGQVVVRDTTQYPQAQRGESGPAVIYDLVLQEASANFLVPLYVRNNPQWFQASSVLWDDNKLHCTLSFQEGGLTPAAAEFLKTNSRLSLVAGGDATGGSVNPSQLTPGLGEAFTLVLPDIWPSASKVFSAAQLSHGWDPAPPDYVEWQLAREKFKPQLQAVAEKEDTASIGMPGTSPASTQQGNTSALVGPGSTSSSVAVVPTGKQQQQQGPQPCLFSPCPPDIHSQLLFWTSPLPHCPPSACTFHPWVSSSKLINRTDADAAQDTYSPAQPLRVMLQVANTLKEEENKREAEKKENERKRIAYQPQKHSIDKLMKRSQSMRDLMLGADTETDERTSNKPFDLCAVVGTILAESGVYSPSEGMQMGKCILPLDLLPTWLVTKRTGTKSCAKISRIDSYICAGLRFFGFGFGGIDASKEQALEILSLDKEQRDTRGAALFSVILLSCGKELEATILALSHLVEQGPSQLYNSPEAVELFLLLAAWVLLGDNKKKGGRRVGEAKRILFILEDANSSSVMKSNRRILPRYADDVRTLVEGGLPSAEGVGELVDALSHFGLFFQHVPYAYHSMLLRPPSLPSTSQMAQSSESDDVDVMGNPENSRGLSSQFGSTRGSNEKIPVLPLLFSIYETYALALSQSADEQRDDEPGGKTSPFNHLLATHIDLYAPVPEFWIAYALSVRTTPKLFIQLVAQALDAWLVVGQDGTLQPPTQQNPNDPVWRTRGVFSLSLGRVGFPYDSKDEKTRGKDGTVLLEAARTFGKLGTICNLMLDAYPLANEEQKARDAEESFNRITEEALDTGNALQAIQEDEREQRRLLLTNERQFRENSFRVDGNCSSRMGERDSRGMNPLPVSMSKIQREGNILAAEPLPSISKQQQQQQLSSVLHPQPPAVTPRQFQLQQQQLQQAQQQVQTQTLSMQSPMVASSVSVSAQDDGSGRPSINQLRLRVVAASKNKTKMTPIAVSPLMPIPFPSEQEFRKSTGESLSANATESMEQEMSEGHVSPITPLVEPIKVSQALAPGCSSSSPLSTIQSGQPHPPSTLQTNARGQTNLATNTQLVTSSELGSASGSKENNRNGLKPSPPLTAAGGLGDQAGNLIDATGDEPEMPPLPDQPKLSEAVNYIMALLSQHLTPINGANHGGLPSPELIPSFHTLLGRVYLLKAVSSISEGCLGVTTRIGVFSTSTTPTTMSSVVEFLSAALAEFSTAVEFEQVIGEAAGVVGYGSPVTIGYLSYLLSRFAAPTSQATKGITSSGVDLEMETEGDGGVGGMDPEEACSIEVLHALGTEAIRRGVSPSWVDPAVVSLCRDIGTAAYGNLLDMTEKLQVGISNNAID